VVGKEPPFHRRWRTLPRLGLGLSTEFGAHEHGIAPRELRRRHPDWIQFLEIGIDLERGIDPAATAWIQAGLPATYHFLDLNLEQAESLDEDWGARTGALGRQLGAAWLCGDAGLWHLGPRDRGHGVLMPPILTEDSALEMATNLVRLRRESGFEVLPENPPAHFYAGELHLLDYFARVLIESDSGMLLDLAHLVIYQDAMGCDLFEGLDRFPLERIVELHVAGGSRFEHEGRSFIDDDHSPAPLPETWELLRHLLPRLPSLRAIVFECERNPIDQVAPHYETLLACVQAAAPW